MCICAVRLKKTNSLSPSVCVRCDADAVEGWSSAPGRMFASAYWACPLDEQLSFITAACHPLSLPLSPPPLLIPCSFLSSLALSPALLLFLDVSGWSVWSCHPVSPPSAYRFTDLCLTMDKCLHATFSVFSCTFLLFHPLLSYSLTCSLALSSLGRGVNNPF